MSEAIEAMKAAFTELSIGKVTLPVRECVVAPGQNGVDLVMPCHSDALKRFSVKTVTVFAENPKRDLPTTQGLLVLTDGVTGSHLAIMDGSRLTAIRTGAASGLATSLLARVDASVVAVFGAGTQARTQLEAVCCVRPIERANVYSPSQTSAHRFASEMAARLGIVVEVATTPTLNVQEADVICTATPSSEPVLADSDVSSGVHINAVGAYRVDMAEIPPEVVCRSRVVVDHRVSALEEAGDLIAPIQQGLIPESHIESELGDLLLGRFPGRERTDEITLFKSVGVAIQDLHAAEKALENARQLSLGVPLT
jgi:ornithine cyclodeaminase/alanine dehydrogenase-like protein (mu-crystallin family)